MVAAPSGTLSLKVVVNLKPSPSSLTVNPSTLSSPLKGSRTTRMWSLPLSVLTIIRPSTRITLGPDGSSGRVKGDEPPMNRCHALVMVARPSEIARRFAAAS